MIHLPIASSRENHLLGRHADCDGDAKDPPALARLGPLGA
jgi:hypothetical protein